MCAAAGPGAQAFLLRSAASFITRILSVFGLASAPGDYLGFVDAAGAAAGGGGSGGCDDGVEAVLDAFTAFRWAFIPFSYVAFAYSNRSARVAAECLYFNPAAPTHPPTHPPLPALPPGCRDGVRGLAKSKAPAAQLQAVCASAALPADASAKASAAGGRAAGILAAFHAFHAEVAALATGGDAGGGAVQEVLAACDR